METKEITIEGLRFKVRKKWDEHILKDELENDMYLYIDEVRVVIDVGAHIGGTAIYYASRGAKVYAFEPEIENYELLVGNVKLNNVEDKVVCFQKGIGTPGRRKLWLVKENTGMCSTNEREYTKGEKKYEMVDIISLEEAMKDIEHCDLLKVDCEGCEYEFLLNLTKEMADKIDYITAELHFRGSERIIENLKHFYQVDCFHILGSSTEDVIINCEKL